MASSTKPSTNPTARRKSSKPSLVITLKLSSKALQTFAPKPLPPVAEAPSKDVPPTPTPPTTAISSNGDNPAGSNSNTPAPVGTPGPSLMPPPPTEGGRKKGVKRGAPVDPNAPPKVRGKPGPKKKARLEDGSIDHSSTAPRAANGTAHKLGPKANQGAINAGLRALDRSGKPCRKWQKGGFTLKSFTGVVWEIPRWKAPPKMVVESKSEGQSASGDSSKENKENSQMESTKSEKSNSGAEVENGGTPAQNASSPAPSNPSTATAAATNITVAATA